MEELLNKIEETVRYLYQNEEAKGMEAVQSLLETFQKILMNTPSQLGASMQRELLEAYRQHDIMAMADCLEEKAAAFVMSSFEERPDGII